MPACTLNTIPQSPEIELMPRPYNQIESRSSMEASSFSVQLSSQKLVTGPLRVGFFYDMDACHGPRRCSLTSCRRTGANRLALFTSVDRDSRAAPEPPVLSDLTRVPRFPTIQSDNTMRPSSLVSMQLRIARVQTE